MHLIIIELAILEKEILAIFEIEIGEHAVGEFVGEAGRKLRIVETAGKFRRLRFDQLPAPVGDEDIAVRPETLIAVAERNRVIERTAAARQRDFAAIELRFRIMGAKARGVAELARTAGALDDDIGDLPALSIGEALETLTGASSHREQGGATEISIRGLGPYLGSTVMNGREAANGSGDRSVNFSQFPSELFNKVAIYKTQSAELIEGGVSGQIHLDTIKT